MQVLLDLAPLVAFLVAYHLAGIYAATATLMVAMVLLVLVDLVRLKRIPPLHGLSAGLVLILGTVTLILRDTRFLKWKPTIFLWAVAVFAVGSAWIGREPMAQRLMGAMVPEGTTLPRAAWLKMNWLWALFYALLGAVNLWFAFHTPERTWVNFKVFGLTAAFLAFALLQAAWLSRSSPRPSSAS